MYKGKSSVTQKLSDDEIRKINKNLYNTISKQLDSSKYGQYSIFLNWGYVPDENPQHSKIELPKNYLNKNSVKLILELVGDVDITNCEILDIGCGRGGTIDTLSKLFKVNNLTGIDLSSANIAFCKRNFESNRIRFFEGDAMNLPLRNNSFDIVTNVESSGAYPDVYKFYVEVFRVLRMGGYFLYTDLFKSQFIDGYLKFLVDVGFFTEIDRDISTNVLLSRDEVASVQKKCLASLLSRDEFASGRLKSFFRDDHEITDHTSDEEQELFQFFMAPRGSRIYEQIKSGEFAYRMYRLRKIQSHEEFIKSVEK